MTASVAVTQTKYFGMEQQPLLNGETLQQMERENRTRRIIRILGTFVAAVAVAGVIFAASLFLIPLLYSRRIAMDTTANATYVIEHLKNLEKIANDPSHGGSRSTTRGYNASAEYVVGFLKNHTDYNVWTQPVTVIDQRDRAPPVLIAFSKEKVNGVFEKKSSAYAPGVDVASFRGSGSGSLEESLAFHVVGCDPVVDLGVFAKFEKAIAVVGYSSAPGRAVDPKCVNYCSRAAAAVKAGAAGVVFYPSPVAYGYPRPLPPFPRGRCTEDDYAALGSVPVVGLSQNAGFDLLQRVVAPEGLRLTLKTNTKLEPVTVVNVLAETHEGNDESVVFFTSHLDSVPAGPGVNDDGSGSAATLELAHAFYRSGLSKKTVQKLRFGWWCAEETGLEGSRYYVEDLYEHDRDALYRIKLNIDTDMIASPNYVRGVWDGRGLDDPELKKSAGVIQGIIEGYFKSKGLPTVPFTFNGRSDFVAFLNKGIPAGGVITGEDEIKTPEEAELFGGIAGMVLDPCYHQKCDTVESLRGPGVTVLGQNLAALAHTLERFALEKDLKGLLGGTK
ncbi:hypothetical protein HDU96_008667 [Phlyctochytrium bullatum]|nr:hypothetical protein HDU96_008667 [Phlyctochytrium bullatum]